MALLSTQALSAGYGKISAMMELNVEVEAGQIVSVVGPNGAGKSTLLNTIAGLHKAASGSVIFNGRDITKLSPEDRLKAGLCIVPEKRELFASMSVEDNLLLGGYTRRADGRDQFERSLQEVFERFPRLRERRQQLAGTLSGGERQMLALGRALMARPKLLLLDEPSLGLAPKIVAEVFEIVSSLKKDGVSIFLVEQNARGALAISDFGYVLETGTIALSGNARTLMSDRKIIETYLGSSRKDASV